MNDVTTMLSNFAFTAANQAETRRREAAEHRAAPRAGDFAEYDRTLELKAAQCEAEAARWEARAAEARRGYLLVQPDDLHFQMDPQYADLFAHCASAGRVRSVAPENTGQDPAAGLR